jgi:hypothetical protein
LGVGFGFHVKWRVGWPAGMPQKRFNSPFKSFKKRTPLGRFGEGGALNRAESPDGFWDSHQGTKAQRRVLVCGCRRFSLRLRALV